jgi:hypothetical protein
MNWGGPDFHVGYSERGWERPDPATFRRDTLAGITSSAGMTLLRMWTTWYYTPLRLWLSALWCGRPLCERISHVRVVPVVAGGARAARTAAVAVRPLVLSPSTSKDRPLPDLRLRPPRHAQPLPRVRQTDITIAANVLHSPSPVTPERVGVRVHAPHDRLVDVRP